MIAARRLAPAVGLTVTVVTSAGTGRADAPHAVVVCGEGTDGEEVVSRVASHLRPPYRFQEAGSFCKGLSSGQASTLATAARDRVADGKLVTRARAAAQSAHADLAILVDTRRSKGGAALVHVWLIDSKGEGSAEVDREVTLGAGASSDEQGDAAWTAVAADLGASSDETRSTAEPASAPREGGRDAAIGSVRVAMETGARDFTYVDRLTTTLRSYSLFAAPLVHADAELYPLARTGAPVLKDVGVTFDYAMAFGLSSSDSAGASVKTTWSFFDVGARERIHAGSWLLGLHAGYGEMTYSFGGALETTAELPGVQYRFVRGGADARVALGPLSVYGSGSYLYVLSTGPLGTYFTRASVGGIEGRVGVARALGHGFEISLEFAYTRFFYTLNPQPGDAYVAGGALDQMAFGSLGVAYVF